MSGPVPLLCTCSPASIEIRLRRRLQPLSWRRWRFWANTPTDQTQRQIVLTNDKAQVRKDLYSSTGCGLIVKFMCVFIFLQTNETHMSYIKCNKSRRQQSNLGCTTSVRGLCRKGGNGFLPQLPSRLAGSVFLYGELPPLRSMHRTLCMIPGTEFYRYLRGRRLLVHYYCRHPLV